MTDRVTGTAEDAKGLEEMNPVYRVENPWGLPSGNDLIAFALAVGFEPQFSLMPATDDEMARASAGVSRGKFLEANRGAWTKDMARNEMKLAKAASEHEVRTKVQEA